MLIYLLLDFFVIIKHQNTYNPTHIPNLLQKRQGKKENTTQSVLSNFPGFTFNLLEGRSFV